VGLRHPLKHLRGKAIQALRREGIQVDVVGEDLRNKIFEVTLGLYFFPLSFYCLQLYFMSMSFCIFSSMLILVIPHGPYPEPRLGSFGFGSLALTS
jgi:hypothetical protein